ncbi:hypothetical protein JR316_0005452 [Psilocybe cubensis]|uniref:DUF6534 domain-containing protein n=2 Tax=Psilocybe cubensis TaxID=181762 RepID=A0A8H7XMM2_PSICU|nr:hypothetical protein JR316_0005452 [Psilocybe cubensis]KAH9483346.1 hypothetical protein JR316_0005452 [Psilocybe cubensis]
MSAESIIDVHRTPNWVVFISKYNWLVISALALGAATDILIAASMLFYLRKLASSGNFRRLVRYSLQTGLITSLTSVTVIICFKALRNLVWFGLYIVLAKIYSNSLLASLNARPRSERQPNRQRGVSTGIDFETVPRAISVPFHITNPTNTSGSDSDWPSSSNQSENRRAFKSMSIAEEPKNGIEGTAQDV